MNMGVDEDINDFEKWAQSLGCPAKSLPPKKTLNRIFSSGQMLAFNDLMRRVRPMQEVKTIRDEIKVRKIERLGNKTVGVKKVQSEQMYLYETEKKLKERSEQQQIVLSSQKQKYEKMAQSLKENNIQILQLTDEIENISAKTSICKLKTHDVERQIASEKEIGKSIDEITPAKFTVSSAIEKKAADALITVEAELHKFYGTFNRTEEYEVNLVARQQLWQKLREAFAQIPNLVLWTKICEQLKQKQQTIEALTKMDLQKILYFDADNEDFSQINGLQIHIGKLHAKHIKLCVMRHAVNKKSENLTKEYVVHYESFLHDVRTKFAMCNNQNIDDDFLGDYVGAYVALYYDKGEIEYLVKTIAENEQEIQRRKKSNDEYRIANAELTKIYEDIENLYIRTHEDLYNLTHVREKIQHSEELIRYLLQCKKDLAHVAVADLTLARLNNSANSSIGSNDSLYSSRSDSFSSTGQMGRSETIVHPMPSVVTSNHLNEMKVFLNIPIENFKLRNPLQSHLDLCMNPLIGLNVFNQLPTDVQRIIFDHLLTPEASIKLFHSQANWIKQMESINVDESIGPDILPEVDEAEISTKKNHQNESLAELTDETLAICANIHRIFHTIDRYMKFIEENPLSKLVPPTEIFNGKTYQEYEREFMMYYKMIEKPDGS